MMYRIWQGTSKAIHLGYINVMANVCEQEAPGHMMETEGGPQPLMNAPYSKLHHPMNGFDRLVPLLYIKLLLAS